MSQVTSQRGRPFVKGNPGRKPGSRNRASVVAAALVEGEAEELARSAVQIAKAGDPGMLKFLLGRFLPRERLIHLELPTLESANDAVEALGCVLRAVSQGEITPSEGAVVAALINSISQAIDRADVAKSPKKVVHRTIEEIQKDIDALELPMARIALLLRKCDTQIEEASDAVLDDTDVDRSHGDK